MSLSRQSVHCGEHHVPKLWDATIEEHRRAVRNAALDTAAMLLAKHGVRSVTMSEIAEQAGIGRATLYKYFPDVEALLTAWHERQIAKHLAYLEELAANAGESMERLTVVLEAYALIEYEHRSAPLDALLHRGQHVARAQTHLRGFIARLLLDASANGQVRDDASPHELASYCLHALAAARDLTSKAAVRRLVSLTIGGLSRGASR